MKARRLGVYGGSFDPIHAGHLAPVEEVRKRLSIDTMLFVPAFAPPHKPSGTSAGSHHRFAMAALALEPYPAFVLSDFEVARGGTTYTVETLRHVRAVYPEADVFLVVGSDTYVTLDTWRSWREILEMHRVGIVYREPLDYASTKATSSADLASRLAPEGATSEEAPEGATVFWGGNAPVTISSTWLRKRVAARESLNGSLPPAVETYIRKHGLYRTP